ncbi:hypothetical protein P1D17_004260 [Acinetobacter baumannii]|uniref:hypothetical protein n=1 Tax=Acinetobacter baumannii TaxID=470 RepID=UPI000AD88F6D|nr:hypothetical protein [Acinetobacter baumannii]MDF9673312.1 hypothetical protein [Acinetobacter baumannii]MDF9688064.1 hypothetical protein [Acinetobacter baumannii]
MNKPMTFNEWMGKQGNLALVHANCCRIAYEAGQQSQQAKVEGLQDDISLMLASHKRMSVGLLQQQEVISEHEKRRLQLATEKRVLIKERDELQKRVDAALKLMQKPVIVGEPAKYVCARFKEIEQALKGECRHESDGTNRLSLPPKTKCKKCGKFYSANVLKGEG